MQIAHWCILVVIVIPYILVGMARLPGITLEKNLIPRIVSESLTGAKQRLFWAHLNALEMIAPFAAAVLIAQSLHVDQQLIDTLAVSFVAFRIAHAVMYVANRGVLRTAMFAGGMVCVVMLFANAA